jgi:hypothetical protein
MTKLFITLAAVLASIIALCLPVAALAGTQAPKTKTETGWSHVMCASVEGTGVCDEGTAVDVFAVVDMYDTVTFTLFDAAGSSLAECEIFAATPERTTLPTTADISALGGTKINSTSLSDTQQKIQFSNINYKYMWVSCGVLDASTSITMQGSVGRTRIAR